MRLNGMKEWNRVNEGSDFASRGFQGGFSGARPQKRMRILIVSALGLLVAVTLTTILLVASGNSNATQPAAPAKVVVEKAPPIELADILVPVKEIEQGRPLEPTLFMRVKRPRSGLPAEALSSYDDLRGAYAKSLLSANQLVLRTDITNKAPQNPVIEGIPDGFRAVTINVNQTTGVEGWTRAGARVDVHWITDVLGEKTANMIVPNAKVLSAERQPDPRAEPNAPIPTTVTLLVNEKDAQKILLAQTGGMIALALRGSSDSGKATAGVTSMDYRALVPKTDSDSPQAEGLEGVVRVRDDDGENREWAVFKGKILRRSGETER